MASTTLITNMRTVIATGPSIATAARANNPNGPIMDMTGNLNGVYLKLAEAQQLLQKVLIDTDSADPNLTTLQNIAASLV